MRMLLVATIVLAVAVGDFLIRGRGYLDQQQSAEAALAERVESMKALQRELPVISRAEHAAAVDERDAWSEHVTRRYGLLTQIEGALVVPSLKVQIESTRLAGLQPGQPARLAIQKQAQRSALVEGVLTRLLDHIQRSGIVQVEEITVLGSGDLTSVPGIAGLASVEVQVVVHSGLGEIVTCLETLVPGATRPTLSIRTASIQRVGRERWLGLPIDRMVGPPVRLTATITAFYPDNTDGANG